MFFKGEPIDFEYEKIGFVKSQGPEFASSEHTVDHLLYFSWKNCAYGIINLKKERIRRDEGYFLNEDHDDYVSKFFTGLVVRIPINQQFQEKNDPQ